MKIRFRSSLFIRLDLTIIAMLLVSLPALSQSVRVISEHGENIEIPKELARDLISEPDNGRVIISTWFVSRGFLDAQVENIGPYEFRLSRGCLYELSAINLDPREWNSKSLSPDVPFSSMVLEEYIQKILYGFEQKGYPFAKAEIDSLVRDQEGCKVEAKINIDPGELLYSEEVFFSGAKTNSQQFLRKISGYRDSVLVTSQFLAGIRLNLLDSELFEEVGEASIVSQEGKYVIVYPLTERSLNHFDGLLGYVPDQNGNGQIVGELELSLWNVLNEGNGVELEYQRLRPETSRLNIAVRQEWIGALPVGIGADFRFYQNDTTYQIRELSMNSYYRVSRGLRLIGEVGLISSSSGKDSGVEIEPDGSKRYAELGFRYSTTNSFEVPTSGIRLGVTLGVTNKDLRIDSLRAYNQQYVQADGSLFFPVSSKQVFALGIHGFYLSSSKITISDLAELGGANSMRGYAEDQFRASKMAWADLEYRFMMNRNSYLFVFGAAGSYERPKLLTETDDSFSTSSMLYSTGFGISYKIRIGRLKFTYAISPQESIGNGKVHLGIRTSL